jgi:hypothetical protein
MSWDSRCRHVAVCVGGCALTDACLLQDMGIGARTPSALLPTRLALLARAHAIGDGDGLASYADMLMLPLIMPATGGLSDSLRRDVRDMGAC